MTSKISFLSRHGPPDHISCSPLQQQKDHIYSIWRTCLPSMRFIQVSILEEISGLQAMHSHKQKHTWHHHCIGLWLPRKPKWAETEFLYIANLFVSPIHSKKRHLRYIRLETFCELIIIKQALCTKRKKKTNQGKVVLTHNPITWYVMNQLTFPKVLWK